MMREARGRCWRPSASRSSDATLLSAYLRALLAREAEERLIVLFLDCGLHLIREEIAAQGTVDHLHPHPREIIRRALELGATAMILVHNHPGGSPEPSRADLSFTRSLAAAAKTIEIMLVDHLIVARSGLTSLRDRGLI